MSEGCFTLKCEPYQIIHWDYVLIIFSYIPQLIDKLPKNSTAYVGYYIGSFSPVHNAQVDIMNKLKTKLENIKHLDSWNQCALA